MLLTLPQLPQRRAQKWQRGLHRHPASSSREQTPARPPLRALSRCLSPHRRPWRLRQSGTARPPARPSCTERLLLRSSPHLSCDLPLVPLTAARTPEGSWLRPPLRLGTRVSTSSSALPHPRGRRVPALLACAVLPRISVSSKGPHTSSSRPTFDHSR